MRREAYDVCMVRRGDGYFARWKGLDAPSQGNHFIAAYSKFRMEDENTSVSVYLYLPNEEMFALATRRYGNMTKIETDDTS